MKNPSNTDSQPPAILSDEQHHRDFGDLKVTPYYTMVTPSSHENHTYASKLEEYYKKKYSQTVTPIAILKTLSVISSTFKDNNKLWILNIAPSRQLKSKTSEEQNLIFTKRKLQYVGSDFTIHGLRRKYADSINNKCLMINDMALLLGSKAVRTKARLIDALSELASEGRYDYDDYRDSFTITARFSLIANITPTSYLYNRKTLLGNTFTERCLIVYHQLTETEMTEANLNRAKKNSLKIKRFKSKIKEKDVKISREDKAKFNEIAKRWRILGAYTSSSSLFDMIKSVAVAYAILNGDTTIGKLEYRFLDLLEPHIRSPYESVKLKILELAHQGCSIGDICHKLGHDYDKYRSFVSRTINEYRKKGVLSVT